MTRVERKPVRFEKWTPVKRDGSIRYSYVNPRTGRHSTYADRWQRQKAYLAQAALWTGAEEFTVYGGVGSRAWVRTVLVSQEAAEEWLREAAARDFTLKGLLGRALAARDRRLKAELA